MKIVVFLGAGFSSAWGLPVMQEFFQHAKNSEYLRDNDKNFLRKLQTKARNGVSMLQMGNDNLEEVLSFSLASENFNVGYPNQDNNDYNNLCRILQKVYRKAGFKEYDICDEISAFHASALPGKLKTLLGIGQEKLSANDLSIITTNYDVMIEFCLAMFGLRCYLPIKWDAVEDNNQCDSHLYSPKKSGPLLCKLHGSLNWFSHTNDETKLQIESRIIRGCFDCDDDNIDIAIRTAYYPKVSEQDYKTNSVPLIIPPTLFKIQTDVRFREIWDVAGKVLREADKLVFVGFSFPESDTYIQYFLAANLYENMDLRPIEIVDPKADKICERLKKSKFGIRFRKLLKPINGKWEDIDYSVI